MSERQQLSERHGSHVRTRRKYQRLGTGVLIVCVSVLVAKCGGSGKPTDARQHVADTVKRFENAAINHDGSTYCALLTDSERSYVLRRVSQSVGLQGPCPSVMRATLHLFVTNATPRNGSVTSSDVTLRDAHAAVVLPGDRKHLQLQAVGGKWKVSALPGSDFAG
jgi:hypothetical protein